jgi:ABC-type branched-subunit amino acid transport system permease subunit/ABC-type branched-subunit amino acid transport system substrate-binding protein
MSRRQATGLAIAALSVAYVAVPLRTGDFGLSVLVFAGISAIGALGLNLLTGYTGQVSVGHAFFMAVGAYTAVHFGAERGWPLPVWLGLSTAAGAMIGAVVGPFALRLRGHYLAVVSLGVVYVGLHVWFNFESVTGGTAGIGGQPPAVLGPADFNHLAVGGRTFTKAQSWFWLVWALVAAATVLCARLVRSRPGRAMQAIRDREAAAAVLGVRPAWYKIGAFVWSSALAGLAGGLYFGFVEYTSPEEWGVQRSVQFIAIVIVGGAATISGTIIGAVVLGGLPRLVEDLSARMPIVTESGLSVDELNLLLFGLTMIGFLVFEPAGLVAVASRLRHGLRRLRPAVRVGVAAAAVVAVAAACSRGAASADVAAGRGLAAGPTAAAAPLGAAPGFDPARRIIRLGAIAPLTGPVAIIGEPYLAGTRVFFDAVNARGGIGGRYRVEIVAEDNVYDQPTTIQKYQKLKDRVAAFAFILGTGPVKAVLPQLRADNVVAGAGSMDAEWVAEEHLIPRASSAQIAFVNAATWYVTEGGGAGKTICMTAVDNPYGDAGIEGLKAGAAANGFPVAAITRYKMTDQDFTAQVTQLRNAGCQAVFITGLASNTGPIIGAAARLGFDPQWIGQAPTWIPALAHSVDLLPTLTRSFLLVADGPQWGDTSVPGMRRMLDDLAAHRPSQPPDLYFLYGYAHGRAVAALLEEAVAGGDLSRVGILAAQHRLGEVDLEGLVGNYTYGPPERRNPTRSSTIFRINSALPGGLEVVKGNFVTKAAAQFSFDRYLQR